MLIPQSIDLTQIEKTHLIVYVAFLYRQFYVKIRPALVVIGQIVGRLIVSTVYG